MQSQSQYHRSLKTFSHMLLDSPTSRPFEEYLPMLVITSLWCELDDSITDSCNEVEESKHSFSTKRSTGKLS